ncbi:MAG: LLM class flavin-dependent oxidoreductase [Thermoplasmata archaeon]
MRAGLFSVLEPHGTGASETTARYREILTLATEAERAGLDSLWVAEHHFGEAGLLPSPVPLLAAAAARTERIRLGPLVSVLPFHDPVLLAEEYAVLDRIAGGRLNFGCGSGYLEAELAGFGVDAASRHERFDRALATIRAAWRGEPVRVERPGAVPVRLNVTPLTPSGPPITIAVQRAEALPFVARHGAGLALIPYATLESIGELSDWVRRYREAADPASAGGGVAVAMHVYVANDTGPGLAALQRYLDQRRATQSTHYRAKVARDPRHADARTIVERGLALIVRPEELPGRIRSLAAMGIDQILAIVDFGPFPEAERWRTIEALGLAAREATGLPPPRIPEAEPVHPT